MKFKTIDGNSLPIFSVEHYRFYKLRMEAHLSAVHDKMWTVITEGPIKITIPRTALNVVEGTALGDAMPKPRDELTTDQIKQINLD